MPEYRIAIAKKALRELAALPIEIQDRVIKTIEEHNGQNKKRTNAGHSSRIDSLASLSCDFATGHFTEIGHLAAIPFT
ncbi:hypothetical protein KJ068_14215 [bacterium]|nr:hypothetical protein [bacterium]